MKYCRRVMMSFFLLIGLGACASENEVIVGTVSQEVLLTHKEFLLNSAEKNIPVEQLRQIESWPDDLHIDIYFGTWCHDSQREVPKILNILNKNKAISSQLIALDYEKNDPQGLAKSMGVKYTPTFIVSIGNNELGRIIERPTQTLVADITKMLVTQQ